MSSRALRRVMIAIAVIGFGVAMYLTVVHYAGITVLCSSKHNSCEAVQTSVYSKVLGIPVALLGLIGYTLILAALLAPDTDLSRVAVLGFTLFGFGFSAYLTYREVFTLKEICEWCVSSAIMLTLLFVLAAWRYIAGPSQPPVSPP
jgi:uncharacterized membrane protein